MLDPTNITNYNATDYQLEELILFWILAAGKRGVQAAKSLDKFLTVTWKLYPDLTPFEVIRTKLRDLAFNLRQCGAGCYNKKAEYINGVARSKNLDLRTCTVEELESFKGIGRKTSRCFVIHTREESRYAGLDTHNLKFLRANGYPDAPNSTPQSKKRYLMWEDIYLSFVPENLPVAPFDLAIWNKYQVTKV